MTPTDKIRAALERACIWDIEGAEYYRDALRELDGMALVPVDTLTDTAELLEEPCDDYDKTGQFTIEKPPVGRNLWICLCEKRAKELRAMIAPYVEGGDGDAEV